jgi:hypothetical protein
MPKIKQRASNSAAVSKNAIEQAGLTLQKLPEKPKDTWSLREAVTLLHDSIADALSRGYSHDEVASLLAGKGVGITASSLKRYLAAAKREKENGAKPKTRRTRKSRTDAVAVSEKPKRTSKTSPVTATTESSNGTKPGTAETSSPSKRRTKTTTSSRSRTSAKTDAKSAETKTAAKSKPTSRTKTAPRTSTRTRRSNASSK